MMRGEDLFSYDPLWKTMEEKGVTTYQLIKSGVDKHTIHSLKHGESVTILTLERLCLLLDCRIEDVVVIIPENS